MSIRSRVYRTLEPRLSAQGLSAINKLLIVAILLSVASAVIETEPTISASHGAAF